MDRISPIWPAAILLGMGCLGPPRVVHPGTYVDPTGEEYLTIAGTSVSLHVQTSWEDEPERFLDTTYELRVGEDGAVYFIHVADTEHFLGVGRFVWYWDGAEIIRRTDAKTGVVTEFRRIDPRSQAR
jgi:hypothetical protein